MFSTVDRRGRAFIATSAFLAAALSNIGAVPLGIIGILTALSAIEGDPMSSSQDLARPGAVIIALLGLAGLQTGLVSLPSQDRWSRAVWLGVVLVLTIGCVTRTITRRTSLAAAMLAIAVIGSIVIGWRLIDRSGSGPQADVWLMQVSAARAIADGLNPYEDASAPNADPTVPHGSVIRGYPYPPVAMVIPVGAAAVTGEPRWAMLAMWLVFVVCLGTAAWRAGGSLLPLVSLFAVWPLFRVTLFVSWTEPIGMAILAVAPLAARTRRSRRSQAFRIALVAMAAVSKQYFALVAPAVISSRLRDKGRLAIGAVAAALLTLLPYLLLSPNHLFRSLYSNLAAISETRTDSYSLTGLFSALGLGPIAIPRPFWLLLVVIFGILVGRKARSTPELIMASACVLAFAFLTSVAFVNYWLMCAALVAIAAVWEEFDLSLLTEESA